MDQNRLGRTRAEVVKHERLVLKIHQDMKPEMLKFNLNGKTIKFNPVDEIFFESRKRSKSDLSFLRKNDENIQQNSSEVKVQTWYTCGIKISEKSEAKKLPFQGKGRMKVAWAVWYRKILILLNIYIPFEVEMWALMGDISQCENLTYIKQGVLQDIITALGRKEVNNMFSNPFRNLKKPKLKPKRSSTLSQTQFYTSTNLWLRIYKKTMKT